MNFYSYKTKRNEKNQVLLNTWESSGIDWNRSVKVAYEYKYYALHNTMNLVKLDLKDWIHISSFDVNILYISFDFKKIVLKYQNE